jgi:WD40 repeat protein
MMSKLGTTMASIAKKLRRSKALDQLAQHDVLLPQPADVDRYLAAHRALGKLLPTICAKAREVFGSSDELSLELYKDPEIDDQYLTLYVRQQRYAPDLMEKIDRFSRQFDDSLEKPSGYLLITSDFRRPRGCNARHGLVGSIIVIIVFLIATSADAQNAGSPQIKNTPTANQLNGPYRALGDLRAFDFPMLLIEVSPDRKWLAAAGLCQGADLRLAPKLTLVDVASGQVVYELQGHSAIANQLRFSPDGKTLYTGGNPSFGGYQQTDVNLSVWDVATGKRRKFMAAPIWDLSPDGKLLAIAENRIPVDSGFGLGKDVGDIKRGATSFTIRLLDTTTWKEVSRHEDKDATLAALRFSPDGKTLALAIPKHWAISLWDWQSKKETGRLQPPKLPKGAYESFTLLAFHPDGRRLACVIDSTIRDGKKRQISLLDLKTGNVAQTFTAGELPIMALAFTPKSDRLVVDSCQGPCYVFDTDTGQCLEEKKSMGLALSLYRAGLTPDLTANPPELITALWDLVTGKDVESLKAHNLVRFLTPEQLQAMRTAPQGATVYFGVNRPGLLHCFSMAPDNRTIATGDAMGLIQIWDVTSGKETGRFSDAAKSSVGSLTFATAGKRLLSNHVDGKIHVWDVESGKEVESLPGSADLLLRQPAIAANGQLAIPVANSEVVMLWQNLNHEHPAKLKVPTSELFAEFTPDSKSLVIGRWVNGPVYVVDIATTKVVRMIGREDVKTFAISQDGRTLATFERSSDYRSARIRLWDLTTGTEQAQITGAEYNGVVDPHPNGLRFTPDGHGLLVHTRSGLGIWELSTGQCRVMFGGRGHTFFSTNGRLVCSQGPNCVLVWDLTGRNRGGELDSQPLSKDEMAKLWHDLHGDAGEAYAAIWRFAGVPEQAVSFLEEQLQFVSARDPKRVANLIADLDSNKFATRASATAELPKYGRWALKEVESARANNPPLEVRLRLTALLPKLRDYPTCPEDVLALRVIEVLEKCATPRSRQLLETLAAGNRPQFTEPARGALARWSKE